MKRLAHAALALLTSAALTGPGFACADDPALGDIDTPTDYSTILDDYQKQYADYIASYQRQYIDYFKRDPKITAAYKAYLDKVEAPRSLEEYAYCWAATSGYTEAGLNWLISTAGYSGNYYRQYENDSRWGWDSTADVWIAVCSAIGQSEVTKRTAYEPGSGLYDPWHGLTGAQGDPSPDNPYGNYAK